MTSSVRMYRGLSKYLEVIRLEMLRIITYRTNFVAMFFNSFVLVFMYSYLWRAVYANSPTIGDMTLSQMLTYVFVVRAIVVPFDNDIDWRLAERTRTGDIAIDFIRPANLQLLQFAIAIGSFVMLFITTSVPVLALGAWLFGISAPASLGQFALFLFSLLLSFIITTSISYIFGMISFWTFSIHGILFAKIFVSEFLAGAAIPLSLFPDWLRRLAMVLPFQAVVNTPLSIYLQLIPQQSVAHLLALQVFWAVGLVGFGRFLLLKSYRQLEVQGG
jgi:ABC-2 type transport system permease protein